MEFIEEKIVSIQQEKELKRDRHLTHKKNIIILPILLKLKILNNILRKQDKKNISKMNKELTVMVNLHIQI